MGHIQFGKLFGGKLLGDHDPAANPNILDVQVASGDYFANLATILDSIERTMSTQDQQMIDNVIDDLLYLQKYYRIVEK